MFARGRSHSNQITVSQSEDKILKQSFRLDYSQGPSYLFSLSYFLFYVELTFFIIMKIQKMIFIFLNVFDQGHQDDISILMVHMIYNI